MIRVHSFFISLAALCAATASAALIASASGVMLVVAQQPTPAPLPVVREALASGSPLSAPGQDLQLIRYVIAPGTTLPAHTHPGMQVGWIESGILHYAVVDRGEVSVRRKGNDAAGIETLRAGQETDLHPGDTLVETAGVIHHAANQRQEPVVIWVAALLQKGEPPATLVEPPRQ